jgi:hypothetical protein
MGGILSEDLAALSGFPLISTSHMMFDAETTRPASAASLTLFKACVAFRLGILTTCEWPTSLSTRSAFPYTLATWSCSIAFLTHVKSKDHNRSIYSPIALNDPWSAREPVSEQRPSTSPSHCPMTNLEPS